MPMADDFGARVVRLFEEIHPLDQVARAGYVLRGVTGPESIAAHSHFVALLALLVLDECPGEYDRDRVLTLALIHDLAEARLMDIPMPAADAHLREAKDLAETAIIADLFNGFAGTYAEVFKESLRLDTPEARLIKALDKAQMMLKILCYEKEHRGNLAEFWHNPKNFDDQGIPAVSAIFDALCAQAGKPRPR